MALLSDLLSGLTYEILQGNTRGDVPAIVYDSRKVTQGCMFICIEGAVSDGHSYAAEVVKNGAAVLVVTKDIREDIKDVAGDDLTIVRVENSRYAMAFISAAYFGHPAEKLKVIGVTGTKGKTTTTYLIKSILERAGYKVGLIGTIETIIGETCIPANNTTPESYILQETFSKMVEEGCQAVVMEVSSQGLMLHRTQGFVFDIGIFTNLAPDHIGPAEHKDFDDYMRCKGLLFQQCRVGIVNADDAHYKDVIKNHTCQIETFGFAQGADYRADDFKLIKGAGFLGIDFTVQGIVDMDVKVHAPGRFSVYNTLCAIAVCHHFHVTGEQIQAAVLDAKVKGRIEMIKVSEDFTLMIDYAHNAMALESLLTTLKEYEPGRLVCMFGCGGNRSKLRRYEMGEVSGKLADLTVITSDNPRNEEPQDIIDDIKIGIGKTDGEYIEIIDRRDAIAYVIDQGQPGDIIVLAGKGHEDYQEIRGKKYPMDERVIIDEILKGTR